MPITRLVVDDFRNLKSVDISPGVEINFLEGPNGSGKTSLLEAVYTLGLGRSFRTRKFKNLISYQQTAFRIFCEFVQEGVPHRLGVIRQRDGTSVFKLDGSPINSAVDLAALLPCQVIDSNSFQLLEGGPGVRRSFLDWLVFHVKPNFRTIWSEYARCLKQRNSLLRSARIQRSDLAAWDKELVRLGGQIDSFRREIVEAFLPISHEYLAQCEFVESGSFDITYLPGWDGTRSLMEQIEDHFDRDASLGYTTLGPHKADVRFTFNRKPVVEVFSRGQQKAVIGAFYLAQLKTFQNHNSHDCILLIDDLPAELDDQNVRRLCRWIVELKKVQCYLTGIDLGRAASFWMSAEFDPTPIPRKLFHVKHGQITEQPCHRSNP